MGPDVENYSAEIKPDKKVDTLKDINNYPRALKVAAETVTNEKLKADLLDLAEAIDNKEIKWILRDNQQAESHN